MKHIDMKSYLEIDFSQMLRRISQGTMSRVIVPAYHSGGLTKLASFEQSNEERSRILSQGVKRLTAFPSRDNRLNRQVVNETESFWLENRFCEKDLDDGK